MSSSRNLRPLNGRVVVKRSKAEEKAGSIIIPENSREKSMEGVVVAVADKKINKDGSKEDIELKVGDHVVFQKWAGTEFRSGDDELLIIKFEDIQAVIEK